MEFNTLSALYLKIGKHKKFTSLEKRRFRRFIWEQIKETTRKPLPIEQEK